jgi:hypothetical protein
MMCFERCVTSASARSDDEAESGGSPDFESSPDVLIWIRILSGVERFGGSALFKAVAAFAEVRV